jgi:prepilin-type N-terminal cleavage/methylation domain-containing protein
MKVNTSRKSGFTLVEIMIVVAIIGLLAAIAIPNFVKARENSQINACIANLKQIDGAIQTWALEQKKKTGDTIVSTEIFGANNYIRVEAKCPSGTGSYAMTTVGAAAQVTCPNVATNPKHILP